MPINAKGSVRRSTSYSINFATLPSLSEYLPTPAVVTLIQKQYAHDVAILEYPNSSQEAWNQLATGVPVSFTWRKNGLVGTWIGYVSFVSSEIHVAPKKTMQVHCVGSSFPLKAKKPRVFKNKTIPQVASIIAKEHGFKFVGEPNERVFPQLTISGQSYWEWLQEQARRIGYAMFVDGMTLIFRPIDKLLDYSSSNSPVLSQFGKDIPVDGMFDDRTLDYFKVLHGEYVEGTELRNTKTVSGVNPVTGKSFTSSKKPNKVGTSTRKVANDVFFEEHRTGQVVHDATSANAMASGAAHMARFTTPAVVRCQGDVRIRPYKPVYINGVSEKFDGYWVVTEAVHTFSSLGEYQMELKVAADGSGPNKTTAKRTGQGNAIGIVNLEAAMANNGLYEESFNPESIALDIKTGLVKESGQGFNRTPTRWVAKPKSSRKLSK